MSSYEEYPGGHVGRVDVWPRWLVPMLVALFLLSTVGAIGGGWYIAHRLDVSTIEDD